MADKCIGKLTLDISDVDKKITKVNEFLNKIGANVDLESKLSSKISAALNKLVNEAQKAGEEAGRALERGVGNGKAEQKLAGLESNMARLMSEVKTFGREADQTGQTIEKLTGTIQTGFDAAGNKIKEFVNAEGEITKRTEEVRNAVEDQIDAMWKLHDAEEAAYQKQGEAAVEAGLKREEAAAKAAQKEEELAQKQITTMEDTLAKRQAAQDAALDKEISKKEAAIEKEISDYEQAEERKRQASIDAEFAREEARKKSLQVEEEAIAKEIAMMDEAIAKKQEEFQSGKIAEAEQAYKRLTTAIGQYQVAKKAGNQDQMDYWQKEMSAAMSTLSNLEKILPELNLEESARARITQQINAAKTQQDGLEKGVIGTSQATGELESQVKGLLTRYLSLMAVIRAISSLVQNMTEYVSEYSDKMNEIQMITLKTDAEVEQLAETYRNLAKDMSVSSLDMADAAIYFTRQGLAADEIEKRLKNVTMYAKAANVEFKDASEIITAVVNSMGLVEQEAEDGRNAAQRVADVFLNIGDNAATSGQEIGEAMQKAAASAGAFGVSMEWLASYIATVSETTRQEARTIGTAFNTIIARLHQIKQNGYNQEDETKVNDIAKALSKIDVALMDQAGNWRDMEVILEEVASKWDGLDGKTKSYIATTMAGVKQQNVFLALMNDMSKGIEDGSRAYELHEKALDSVGVAEQKYGVYLDSVTASQERLTVAQEEFYSLLNENVIKGWNNALAGFIDMLNSGADAWGSWTIALPVVAALITGLIVAIKGVNMGLKETITLSTMLEKHPVMMAITAAIAAGSLLVTAINAIADAIGSSEQRFNDAKEAIDKYNTSIQNAEKNQKSLAELQKEIEENTELSSKELSNYNSLLTSLESISVRAKNAVISLKNGFGSQSDQVAILNEELDAYIEKQHRLAAMEGVTKYSNYQTENSTYEFASLVPNWHREFNDLESFTSALRDTYDISRLGYVNPNTLLPIDVRDQIKKWFKDAGMAPFGDNTEELWEEIAKNIWLSYFGGDTSFNISEYLANEVNTSIEDAMQLVGFKLNPVDYAVVKQFLTNQIFGEDMELSQDEYKEFSDKISSFIQDMILHGFDPSYLNIPVEEKMVQYVSSIFADVGEELSSAVANDIRDVFGGNTEIYESFISAISEAMDAGFDKEDIYDVLFSTPIEEWDQALEIFKEEIANGLRDLFSPDEGEEFSEEFSEILEGFIGDMSLKEMRSLNDMITSLLDVDVDVSKIKEAIATAETIEEVFESLKKLQEENGIDATGEEGGAVGTLKEFIKEAKAGIKDIQAIDAAIESVKKNIAEGENINYGDIFGLIELHPEIMTVIGDSEKLLETLKKVREEAGKTQFDSFRNLLLDKGTTAGTKYADSGFETLAEYRASIEGNEEAVKEFNEEIDRLAQNLQLADENFKQTTKDEKEAAKEAKNYLQEAQKAFKENLSEVETLDSTIAKLQDSKQIDFSNIINLASTHPEIMNFVQDTDTLLAALERLKAAAKEQTKASLKEVLLNDSDFYQNSIYYDPRYNNLKEYMDSIRTMKDEWDMVNADAEAIASNMVEGADATSSAAETWLDAQMKIAEVQDEVNWAKANNFEDQIRQLQAANEAGGIQDAIALFDSWDKEMQQAVGTEYPAFILQMVKARKAMNDQGKETADLTQETQSLSAAIKTVTKLNDVKYFKDTAKAIKQLSEGTISASDAYDVYTKDLNKVTKAYEDILDVQAKMEYNAKDVNKDNQQAIDAADVNNLATLLGLTTDEILADFPSAVDMFNELIGKTGELQTVIDELNKNAFIRILGVSESDFSDLENGLLVVQNLADEAVQKLLATGQWTTESIPLSGVYSVYENGKIVKKPLDGYQDVLKPTGNNPFKGASTVTKKADTKEKTGRSGGGGGSSKDKNDNFRDKNTTTEVEKMLDLMSQVNAIQQYQQSYYQSQNKYYSQTGQLQGVIAYMQKEKEVLEGQNGTLESNIRRIEEYMSAKQAELASLSTEDEKYKEVADDFDKLQKAHQTYTKQLIDNKSAVEALNQAMEEQRKKIRQMEIDLRNLILGAIEDREKKRTDMLNAEIEMENTIYDLIVKRYEKERDEIIRTTDLKIDALNSERDLLEENLRIRKEEAEQEDKAAKLRELEVKYQRIIADPTRAKEARQLKTEIDSLRKEMAWDLAEEEVKSQQDSIDQQIESLEDYKEYIENYYEDLFEHPQQLIAEMRDIMMGTQEEIINWLKQNDEAYRESSENTQLAMVTGWEETYNEMKGILKTYWDEVEEIIAQGDDYIIEFLKNNSADYAAAGKLQAEAYVDEWKKQLDDLHKAHQTVAAEIAGSYSTIQQYNGSGSSSSSSNGGGSNKSGGSSKTTTTTANMTTSAGGSHYYEFTAFGKNYSADKNSSGQYFANRGEAYSAAEQKIDALYQSQKATLDRNGANAYGYNQLAQAYKTAKNSIRAYKTGGIADYTGPAWVDGSPQDPERILTPYQNKLFESFVKTLEKMATISIPSMPNFGALETTGANPVSVGDIIVNVDNLDTDDDYEEMADRVCEILTERIGRTAVVGGLRIRST